MKDVNALTNYTDGRRRRRQTTPGSVLLMKWKDGSETWTPLKDAKESLTPNNCTGAHSQFLTNSRYHLFLRNDILNHRMKP